MNLKIFGRHKEDLYDEYGYDKPIPLDDKSKCTPRFGDKSISQKIATLEIKISELNAQKDYEIKLLKQQVEANTLFLQQVVMQLIVMPRTGVATTPIMSLASKLAERTAIKDAEAPIRGVTGAINGPVGKLP